MWSGNGPGTPLAVLVECAVMTPDIAKIDTNRQLRDACVGLPRWNVALASSWEDPLIPFIGMHQVRGMSLLAYESAPRVLSDN